MKSNYDELTELQKNIKERAQEVFDKVKEEGKEISREKPCRFARMVCR